LIFEANEFVFQPLPIVSRARRVLIKPCASYPVSYPVTTSPEVISKIVKGIRDVSDADILILDGTYDGEPISPIYQALGYNFPRVLMLDVKDCIWVEVDNPLTKPFIMPTFWVPNVILSSDYLITVSPLKIVNGKGSLSIANLLTTLPGGKYSDDYKSGWEVLQSLGMERVIADLYFTLPFDLGIIEARQKFTVQDNSFEGEVEDCGKIFIGEPYQVDSEASRELGLETDYLHYIKEGKMEFGA
jgi:uncharacterized protein (DUF362 family)